MFWLSHTIRSYDCENEQDINEPCYRGKIHICDGSIQHSAHSALTFYVLGKPDRTLAFRRTTPNVAKYRKHMVVELEKISPYQLRRFDAQRRAFLCGKSLQSQQSVNR